MTQLDLFDWTSKPAIFAFPPCRRVVLVRSVAARLVRDPGNHKFWREVLEEIVDELSVTGMSDDEIRGQLLDFRDAVDAEMARLRGSGPDGDPARRIVV